MGLDPDSDTLAMPEMPGSELSTLLEFAYAGEKPRKRSDCPYACGAYGFICRIHADDGLLPDDADAHLPTENMRQSLWYRRGTAAWPGQHCESHIGCRQMELQSSTHTLH